MNFLHRFCFAVLSTLLVSPVAYAGYVEVTVNGQSGPWNWTPSGLNSAYAYGPETQDFLPPTVVNLASIGTGPGSDLFILYKGGLTSAFGGQPSVDQAGYVGSIFKDDVLGSSGQLFPSNYMPGNWGGNQEFNGNPVADPGNYGIFLQALVAAITDNNGDVLNAFPIGYVIPVSDGQGGYQQGYVFGISFQIQDANAAYLQLGMNDDIFSDNTGSLQVCVASNQAGIDACLNPVSTVPEPSTLLLLAGVCLGLPWLRRSRRI